MFGLRRELDKFRDVQSNQGILEAALDDTCYRPRFPATSLFPVPGTGAALFYTAADAYMAFPNAGTPTAVVALPTQRLFWQDGTLTLRLLWSGDTASAVTNVRWRFQTSRTVLAGVPTAGTAVAATVAGPAGVGALQDYTFTATEAVDQSHRQLGISISRDAANGADTYVGEAWLYSWQVTYTPRAGH